MHPPLAIALLLASATPAAAAPGWTALPRRPLARAAPDAGPKRGRRGGGRRRAPLRDGRRAALEPRRGDRRVRLRPDLGRWRRFAGPPTRREHLGDAALGGSVLGGPTPGISVPDMALALTPR